MENTYPSYNVPLPLAAKQEGITRIITVGDSITEGMRSSDEKTKAYPVQLQNMLGDKTKYEVINLGVSGRTMMKMGDYPYWKEQAYQEALKSNADIVILMLGTNDSKTFQWNEVAFRHDYLEMSRNFLAMESKPTLYVMIPPPLYGQGAYQMNQTVINEVFPELIPQIAQELELPSDRVIDIMGAMGGKNQSSFELFCDGQSCDACHPNDAGYSFMAAEVYKHLFLPPMPEQDWKPSAGMEAIGGENQFF